jgi:orotate phosphoribosyltransferase
VDDPILQAQARRLKARIQVRSEWENLTQRTARTYQEYVEDKKSRGEKPMPKPEWESLGKGKGQPQKGLKSEPGASHAKVLQKANAKMRKVFESASAAVKAFVTDPKQRKEMTRSMGRSVRENAPKAAKAIWKGFKGEVKAIVVDAPTILAAAAGAAESVKVSRINKKGERKTVWISGTLLEKDSDGNYKDTGTIKLKGTDEEGHSRETEQFEVIKDKDGKPQTQKKARKLTPTEMHTLYGVGVYAAGTALSFSGAMPLLAAGKAFAHSITLHAMFKAASTIMDEVFLGAEAVESVAIAKGVAAPVGTGDIPGLGHLIDLALKAASKTAADEGGPHTDDEKFLHDLMMKFYTEAGKVFENLTDADMEAIMEHGGEVYPSSAKSAGYFNPGDEIVYGKYKNKRGLIKDIKKDERGVPTAVVEPVPKGRKKDREIGIYKFWHADPEKRATTELARKDQIPGGLGDKKDEKDFDPKQIAKGVKVEMEHTDDPALAKEIAIDHLTEDPKYYDKLETIEKHAGSALVQMDCPQHEKYGDKFFLMDVRKDRFVHFTPRSRAEQILRDGKLLMRPPYKKFGIDAVGAVSTVWGQFVPGVQTTHIKLEPGDEMVAIVFQTNTVPEYGYPEEVVWKQDVALRNPQVVSASKGQSLIARAPQKLPEDSQVRYQMMSGCNGVKTAGSPLVQLNLDVEGKKIEKVIPSGSMPYLFDNLSVKKVAAAWVGRVAAQKKAKDHALIHDFLVALQALSQKIDYNAQRGLGDTSELWLVWRKFYDAAREWAEHLIDSIAIPKRDAKAVEMAVRLLRVNYGRGKGPKPSIESWFLKNQKRLLVLIKATEWQDRTEDDGVFIHGPFTVHNTVGASDKDVQGVKSILDRALRGVQKADVPGLSQMAYGNIVLVGEIKRKNWAAWYMPNKDVIYLRPKLRGTNPDQIALHLIHEIGHRFWRKKLDSETKKEWGAYHTRMSRPSGAELPPAGSVLPEVLKVNNKQVKVDRYETGVATLLDASTDQVLGSVSTSKLLDWMTQVLHLTKFPSIYASSDVEEHFCEALAHKGMGSLKPDNLAAFNAIVLGQEKSQNLKLAAAKERLRGRPKYADMLDEVGSWGRPLVSRPAYGEDYPADMQERLAARPLLMEHEGNKVTYAVKTSSNGILVTVYYGRKRIGGMNAFVQGYPETQERCSKDVWALLEKYPEVEKDTGRPRWVTHDGEERTNTRALKVFKAFIDDKTKHGLGIGKLMYQAVMAEWFAKVGPFLFMPMDCDGSGTSQEAKRVWQSLARTYPSSGDVIAVVRRPQLPSGMKAAARYQERTAGSVPIYSALVYLSRTRYRGVNEDCDDNQDLIQKLKDGDPQAARLCAQALSKHPALRGFRGVVVPAPRSKVGRPALLAFAQALVKQGVGTRAVPAAARISPVESSRERRRLGLKGVSFEEHVESIAVGGIDPDEDILIVDDIVTTGTTIKAVAAQFRKAGHRGRIIGAAAGHADRVSEAPNCPINFVRRAGESKEAARYQEKKEVPKAKGNGTTTVYVYSEGQVEHRNREKAKRVEKLRNNIDTLRADVKKDLKSDDEKTRLIALAVGLMDHTYERVGNDESAKEGHFGVTGWQKKHVTFSGGKATVKYVGKSGVDQTKTVTDKALVSALKAACEAAEGDDSCVTGAVKASDVNAYLKKHDITAKDIRGYHANTEVQTRLKAIRAKGGKLPSDPKEKQKKLKEEFKQALEETAEAVGHKATTLKSQYLVPGLERNYVERGGKIVEKLDKQSSGTTLTIGNRVFQVLREGRSWEVKDNRGKYYVYFTNPSKSVTDFHSSSRVVVEDARTGESQVFPTKDIRVDRPRGYWTQQEGTVVTRSASRVASAYRRKLAVISIYNAWPEEWTDDKGHPDHMGLFGFDALTLSLTPFEWALINDLHRGAGHAKILAHKGGTYTYRGYPVPSDVVVELQGADYLGPVKDGQIDLSYQFVGKTQLYGGTSKLATKTDAEKEDEDAAGRSRPAPSKKPPRKDLRRNRLKVEDPDTENTGADKDKDLSLNYKRVASRHREFIEAALDRALMSVVAGKVDKEAPKKGPGDYWEGNNGWRAWPPKATQSVPAKDEENAKALAGGGEDGGEVGPDPKDQAKKNRERAKAQFQREVKKFDRAIETALDQIDPKMAELLIDALPEAGTSEYSDLVTAFSDHTDVLKEVYIDESRGLSALAVKDATEIMALFEAPEETEAPEDETDKAKKKREDAIQQARKEKLDKLFGSDAATKGELLARLVFAQKIVVNPTVVGGQGLAGRTKPEELTQRASEAAREYNRASKEIRQEAAKQAVFKLKDMDEEDPDRIELDAILDGIAVAAAAHGESLQVDGEYVRPRMSKGHQALCKTLLKNGDEDTLFGALDDWYGPKGREAVGKALDTMDDKDLVEWGMSSDLGPLAETLNDPNVDEDVKVWIRGFLKRQGVEDMTTVQEFIEAASDSTSREAAELEAQYVKDRDESAEWQAWQKRLTSVKSDGEYDKMQAEYLKWLSKFYLDWLKAMGVELPASHPVSARHRHIVETGETSLLGETLVPQGDKDGK